MNPDLVAIYEEECRKAGRELGKFFRPVHGPPSATHLCADADEAWATIERHAIHVIMEYARWAEQ
jgi:hypothetical protein